MILTIDTSNPLSSVDRTVLAQLIGLTTPTPTVQAVTVTPVTAEEAERIDQSPRDTGAEEDSKPKRTRRTKAEMEAARATEAEVVEAEVVEPFVEAEPTEGPTLADALAAAQSLLGAGEGARVKAALEQVGAAKVSHLAPADIETFLGLISDVA